MVLQGTWSDPLAGDLLAAAVPPPVPFGMSPIMWKKLMARRAKQAALKKAKKAEKKAGRGTGAAGIFARYKLPILIGGGLLAFFMLRRRKAATA